MRHYKDTCMKTKTVGIWRVVNLKKEIGILAVLLMFGAAFASDTDTSGVSVTVQEPNVAPVMNTSTITPSPAYASSTLQLACNATDANAADNITYHWKAFLNGEENETGSSDAALQGLEVNVANISSGLATGQNWTLECTPDDGTVNGTAMNSTQLTISATPGVDGCGSLSSANSVYTLTADVSATDSTCFTLAAANVTLDCAGHSITGNNGDAEQSYKGVYMNAASGTVKNCVISGFVNGISTYGAAGATMLNNTITVTQSEGMTDSYGINIYSGGTGSDKTLVVNNTVNNTNGIAISFGGWFSGEVLAYWNNITASGKYFEWREIGSSVFTLNTTIDGKGEGNIYANVVSGAVDIIGTVVSGHASGYYIGSAGTGYPYDATTSGAKLTSSLVDNAPLTPFTNAAPVVESVSTPDAQDVTPCSTTELPVIQVNVSDADGYADVSAANTYVNISKGAVTHQSATCTEDSHDTDWVLLNCSGAEMSFYDAAGAWSILAYSEDAIGASDTTAGSDMTYNTGVHMVLENDPLTFGTIYSGTENNTNTNDPALDVKNCGNAALNMTVTGANITDGGSNSIPVGSFRVSDNGTPGAGTELVLTEEAQDFSKSGGLAAGASSTEALYAFLNAPVEQAPATYNTGTWAFIVSNYE